MFAFLLCPCLGILAALLLLLAALRCGAAAASHLLRLGLGRGIVAHLLARLVQAAVIQGLTAI